MKIAHLARQLKKALKEHSKLEQTAAKLADSAELAAEQNLSEEFTVRWQELAMEEESLRHRIGLLTEELQECVANGDLEKESPPVSL